MVQPDLIASNLKRSATAKPIPPKDAGEKRTDRKKPPFFAFKKNEGCDDHTQAASPIVAAGRSHAPAENDNEQEKTGPPSESHVNDERCGRIEFAANQGVNKSREECDGDTEPIGVVPVKGVALAKSGVRVEEMFNYKILEQPCGENDEDWGKEGFEFFLRKNCGEGSASAAQSRP